MSPIHAKVCPPAAALTSLPPSSLSHRRRVCREVNAFTQLLRQVQGALPVVGLVSRLTAVQGGIGQDELQYPEYCRTIYEAAPPQFQLAVADLQARHGTTCQRKYVLLVLWMVRQGAGLVEGKSILDAARRIRVS